MLGEQIGEARGRRTSRRVLSVDSGPNVEVTFEAKGKLLGMESMEIGTYSSVNRPDGNLYGEGQGVIMTANGDAATWKGSGIGKLLPGGAVSFRGAIYYSTASQKLARLNSVAAVFEHEIDADGNAQSKVWEWK